MVLQRGGGGGGGAHPVLQGEDGGFEDVEFDGDLRPAGADVTVGAGRVQDARDQKLLPQVGMFVEEDLGGRHENDSLATVKWKVELST